MSQGLAPSDKRVAKVNIKSDGDVFYELWKSRQPEFPSLTPATVKNCQILGGENGTVGCVVLWNYIDGKECVAKTVINDIDDNKKSVTYKVLEGDLLELYKTCVVNVTVETDGPNNLVTWTVEYEKLSPDAPDPDTLMEAYIKATKDIDACYLQGYIINPAIKKNKHRTNIG